MITTRFCSDILSDTIPKPVVNYVNRHHKSITTKACGSLLAVASVEMAFRTVGSAFEMVGEGNKERAFYHFTVHLGRAIFYGLAAANPVPAAARIATFIFTTYCLGNFEEPNTYLVAKLWGRVTVYLLEDVLTPLIRRTMDIAYALIGTINTTIGCEIPVHPIYTPLVGLLIAIVAWKAINSCWARYSQGNGD